VRPSPAEIIAGVRAILADTIAPELRSDHARSRLSEIRAVLAQIDWDNAGFVLRARTTELALRLSAAGPWVPVELPAPPQLETFEEVQRYWEQLAAVAVGVLERLSAHLETHHDDAALEVYRALLAAL
jgi:hypothetical protein